MKNELDTHLLLNVFEKIQKHGEKKEDASELDGVRAFSDPDGYTVYLADALVTMRIGFHNKYHLNYEKPEHFETFEKRLHAIDKNY